MDQYVRDTILMQQTPAQMYLNKGLLSFSQFNYQEAMEHFQSAVTSQRERHTPNLSNNTSASTDSDAYDIDSHFFSTGIIHALDPHDDPHLLTHALNNLALCSFYTCKVDSAVQVMEGLIKENPTLFLTEVSVFNLCTLYELCADGAGSTKRKKVLQSVAKRFFLHDISVENFRITA